MSGGASGTSGESAKVRIAGLTAIIVYVLIQTWANANSTIVDRRVDGVAVEPKEIWALELTSLAAWFIVALLVWRAVRHLRPPHFSWPATLIAHGLAALIGSLLHVGLMVAMREAIWALHGADYVFAGPLHESLLYEARKDLATYAEMALMFALIQWAADNAVRLGIIRVPTLEVRDGGTRHQVPIHEIERVESAANYVEIHWRGRTLLHRATLSDMLERLGSAHFVRVHRGRLVHREAIRLISSLPSGDADLTLDSGAVVRASRRYRKALESDFA